jgi:hypothetical protein
MHLRHIWTTAIGLGAIAAAAQGCAISSPHWDYVPASTSAPIPFQAWATSQTNPVVVECADDTNAHGWPTDGEASYVFVANLTPSATASLDPGGSRVYSASGSHALPSTCWKYFGDYDFWQANLRLSQVVDGSKRIFSSFDKPGLECLGREVGKARQWLGFFDKCEKRYLGSSDKIPYIVLRIDGYAEGLGSTAQSQARAKLAAPAADQRIEKLPAVQSIAPIDEATRAKALELRGR